ncbi:MAG TPA: hypothetical protein VG603_12915 [Chitinophagales bacterium]|nr:hypothetical protein [Chitinophagales bacterium]
MKRITLLFMAIAFMGICSTAMAQGTAKKSGSAKSNTSKTAQKAPTKKPTPPPPPVKPITVSLKNLCEKAVPIFAGPKEGLKDPHSKIKILGGLSTNKLYIKTSDVVCILNAQDKPVSCTNVSENTTVVELNSSGTIITAK